MLRDHWKIENHAHCVLDVTFREDNSRCRAKHSPLNFAILRRLALTILRKQQRRVVPDAIADFAFTLDFLERSLGIAG